MSQRRSEIKAKERFHEICSGVTVQAFAVNGDKREKMSYTSFISRLELSEMFYSVSKARCSSTDLVYLGDLLTNACNIDRLRAKNLSAFDIAELKRSMFESARRRNPRVEVEQQVFDDESVLLAHETTKQSSLYKQTLRGLNNKYGNNI